MDMSTSEIAMKTLSIPNAVILEEARKLINDGMEVTIKTKGVSMLPFIRGDRDSAVLIKCLDPQEWDIVLAKVSDGRYVLHRVIRREGEILTLMGDGSIKATEKCSVSDVIGKTIRIEKPGKSIDCTSEAERRKAAIWRKLLPLRRYILFIYRKIYGINYPGVTPGIHN